MTAFVTGGSGEIGRAICISMAEIGCDVCVCYNSDKESAEKTVREIASKGQNAIAVKCDITDITSIDEAVSQCENSLGKINILINNAGVSDINLFTQISSERMNYIINSNLTGAMNAARRVLAQMINVKSGCIINISSMWGEVGASCEVVYSAAKAGLIGFTKALAKEVGLSGIRVNCITPGMIDTKMNSELSQEDIEAVVEDIPLSRIGTPKDVAQAAAFLASENASYITGAVLKVNGGLCI